MTDFKFSNEEIVFMYKHFSDYKDSIENQLQKQITFAQGYLELIEKTYGEDVGFDRENFDLNMKLVKEEIPNAIHTKVDFLDTISEKFRNIYEMILEADPDFVKNVEDQYFKEPQAITEIINQLRDKNNNDGNNDEI